MTLLSIQRYAVKHHLPIYNVIKMVKNGELPIQKKMQDGKEETFIVMSEEEDLLKHDKETDLASSCEEISDYKMAYKKLEKEYQKLLEKYMDLKEALIKNGG